VSGPSSNPPTNPRQRVTVEVELDEAALTGAAFNLLNLYAKAYDISDIEEVYVKLTVAFEGWPYPSQLESFKERIREFSSASVRKVELMDESSQGRHVEVGR